MVNAERHDTGGLSLLGKAIIAVGVIFLISVVIAQASKNPEYFQYATWYLTFLVLLVTMGISEKTTREVTAKLDKIYSVLSEIKENTSPCKEKAEKPNSKQKK